MHVVSNWVNVLMWFNKLVVLTPEVGFASILKNLITTIYIKSIGDKSILLAGIMASANLVFIEGLNLTFITDW